MTEARWLECADPLAMLEFLRGSPTSEDAVTWWKSRWQTREVSSGADRKFRLFACACCRRVWDRIPMPCNRDAVIAVEGWLEGRVTGEDLETALVASSAVEYKEDGSNRSEPGYWAVKDLGRGFYKLTAAASALVVAATVAFMADDEYGRGASVEFLSSFYTAAGVFIRPFRWPLPIPAGVRAERQTQAGLLHCIFGNPFRPVTLDPAWLTPAVVSLARTIYEERTFERLPELADDLFLAGCNEAEVLAHCRGLRPHTRGCWVLDLVLGKS